MTNIVGQIVEKRKKDIEKKGYTFGFEIPAKRDMKRDILLELDNMYMLIVL